MKRSWLGLSGYLLAVSIVSAHAGEPATEDNHTVLQHYGYTAADKFTECVKRIFGKNVLYSPVMAKSGPELADTPCPSDPIGLRNLLNQKGISVFETAEWVFLVSSILVNVKPGDPYYGVRIKWKALRVAINIHAAKLPDEDAPGISEAEVKAAGEAALKQARMCPVVQPDATSGDEGIIKLDVAVRKVELEPNAPQDVISVITQADSFGGNARMVYEKMLDGQYRVLWDSPLFQSGDVALMDVDGDGWKEILISFEERAVKGSYSTLVIFDHEGHELTRQRACDPGGISGEVCPIGAANISFGENESGPRQVNAGTEVYVLADGVYVAADQKQRERREARREAAEHNQQGVKLLRAGRLLEAMAQFMGAASGDRANAEYVNNLGFAEFKDGRYDDCIQHFGEAIELDPRRAVAYLNLADALLKQNATATNKAMARQAYGKYIELAPDSKGASEVTKKLDALSTQPQTSSEVFTWIDAVDADVAGSEKMKEGKYADALSRYLQAVNNFPYNPKFLTDAGIAYYRTGKPEEALLWLNKAIGRDPQYASAYIYLGDANSQLKRFAQAREGYGRYLQLEPDSSLSPEVKKKLDALPPL